MRPNRLREAWNAGRPVLNGWCSIGSPFVAEAMASAGWDSLTLDVQHGFMGYTEMAAMLQAVTASGVTPLVRVPWNTPGDIMKALDAGALGIICPMISTAAECRTFVEACRYQPEGTRSYGPTRAALAYGPDYTEGANREVVALAMIETAEGLINVEDIVATPGLDGVYIGPSDLNMAHGGPALQDNQDPALLARFETILKACKARGLRTGVHTTSVGYSKQMIAMGFDLVTVGADLRYLLGARREAKEMRDHLAL